MLLGRLWGRGRGSRCRTCRKWRNPVEESRGENLVERIELLYGLV